MIWLLFNKGSAALSQISPVITAGDMMETGTLAAHKQIYNNQKTSRDPAETFNSVVMILGLKQYLEEKLIFDTIRKH